MKKRQHFPSKGMTCRNCVRHVEKALKSLPGIVQLEVNLEKQEAFLEYDSTVVTFETMASALKDAVYINGQIS